MKLKPCPFCGGEAKVSLFLGNYGVACTKCLGAILPVYGTTKEENIEAWNRREPIDKIVERLEIEKILAEGSDSRIRNKAFKDAIEIVKGGVV